MRKSRSRLPEAKRMGEVTEFASGDLCIINPVLALLLLVILLSRQQRCLSSVTRLIVWSREGATSLAAVAANDLDAGGRWLRLADGLFYSR